jgi:hypothetical protein
MRILQGIRWILEWRAICPTPVAVVPKVLRHPVREELDPTIGGYDHHPLVQAVGIVTMLSRIPFENPAMEIGAVRQVPSCAAKPGGELGNSIEKRSLQL